MRSFIIRRKLFLVLLALAVIVSGELFCRMVLGLGDPPLYVTDPQIEYMMKPDQDVKRFGNHVFVNHWGMRSPEISQHKQNTDEIRVLIFGDSVVNGGSETDQSLLATTLMQQRLQTTLGRPVVVGNISAGSWGPGNWLAYAKRYGFFDADVLVLVVNSGDFADNPTFAPLKSSHPTQKPLLALQEAVFRYLPRYLPSFDQFSNTPTNLPTVAISAEAIAQGDSDLRQFLTLAQAGGVKS